MPLDLLTRSIRWTSESLERLSFYIPPNLRQGLEILLSQSPHPDAALRRLEAFCEAHPAEFQLVSHTPFGLQALIAVFSSSEFLSAEVQQHPDWLIEPLTSGSLHHVRSAQEIEGLLDGFIHRPGVPRPLELAQFRRQQILRILLRDVLGFGALPEIVEELSSLADALLNFSLRAIRRELCARHGSPRLEDGTECGFSVLALGKLGGCELNYSSDIDLMFIYAGQGETDGAQKLTNKEFFKKVANQFTELLSTYTPEGMCYRVDLRLRPEGRLGEVCISLEGAKAYYEKRARDWELQMLIKARVAAGETGPGRALLESVQPRIYSSTLDFSLVESMSATRERLSEKMNSRQRSSAIDIKLARGGIRDIEFLVQCLQRVHGGREAWLRNSSTLLALTRLRDKDLLSDTEYSRLSQAYQFLRHLEHRLQFDADIQTHTLPEQAEALALVARRMPARVLGETRTAESLLQQLKVHLARVLEIYERVVHAQQPMFYAPHTAPVPLSEGQTDAAGHSAPAAVTMMETQTSNLVRFLEQKAPRLAAAVQRARLGRNQSPFEHFLEHTVREPELLTLLDGDPVLSGHLLDLFEHSPYLAEQLVRMPELVYQLRGMQSGAPVDYEELAASQTSAVEIRRFYRRQMFRLLAKSVCLQVPVFQSLEEASDLADAVIRGCLRLALAQVRDSRPPLDPGYEPHNRMMVIALGRLGMHEFDLGSDADLVFVIPDEDLPELHFWTRVAEKLVDVLSSYAGEGTLFAVDTRLRPNGRSGALVQSVSAFHEYFARHAEAWEGITYMKARAVAGDLDAGTRFLEELQKVDWRRYGQSGRSKHDLRAMRARLEKEQGEQQALKSGFGGYYDIDFALMYLRLKGAGMFFKVLNTPARIEVVERMGHLDPADANFLRDAATFYRAVDHGLRVINGHSEATLPNSEAGLEMLTRLLVRWVPQHLCDQAIADELRQIQSRTREFFERLFA